MGKAKSGGINPSDVDDASSALTDVHDAATSGGAGFTDNANASITRLDSHDLPVGSQRGPPAGPPH